MVTFKAEKISETKLSEKKAFLLSREASSEENTLILPEEVGVLDKDCFKGLTNI